MFASETYFLQQLAILVVYHGLTAADIGSQYFLVQIPMSWDRSREFCQSHYVDLAVLSTEEDYFHLLKATAAEKVNFWLGLQRNEEQRWTWVDGEALNYHQWRENKLGQCGSFESMLKTDKKMLSRFCHEPHAFVCQGPQAPTTRAVSVVSGSHHVVLSWNVSSLMQMTSHIYNVTTCSRTCTTTWHHQTRGSASITITIFNLTSDTNYTFEISAALIRPDNSTGDRSTLSPTILRVRTEDTNWRPPVIHMILKSLKVVFLAPLLWVFYLIFKKGEEKGSSQDMSLMDLPAEDTVVDIFPVRTRAAG